MNGITAQSFRTLPVVIVVLLHRTIEFLKFDVVVIVFFVVVVVTTLQICQVCFGLVRERETVILQIVPFSYLPPLSIIVLN